MQRKVQGRRGAANGVTLPQRKDRIHWTAGLNVKLFLNLSTSTMLVHYVVTLLPLSSVTFPCPSSRFPSAVLDQLPGLLGVTE
jgi:hypothetical protein